MQAPYFNRFHIMISPASFTPGITVTETVNDDGSITTTTVTVHEDGSKTTKRKTKRSKKPAQAAQTKSPVTTASKPSKKIDSGSMEDALEEILNAEAGGHKDDEAFERAVRRCIPSEFVLIASQDDISKAQEAIHAADIFTLPDAIGNAGSVATSALLHLMHKNLDLAMGANGGKSVGCLTLLQDLRATIKKATGLNVNPQICSSRPLGPPRMGRGKYAPFHIVPAGYTGKKRALLIGIRFLDDVPSQRLKGPHNDVHNIQQYLKKNCGFQMEDIVVLVDDGKRTAPTKANILKNFRKLTEVSQPGDVVFVQYSGHGGRMKSSKGEGQDPFDNYILPSDHKTAGHILDDDILKDFIKAMPSGVYSTMLVDCCNSGTVADLPYVMKAKSLRDQQIEPNFDTDTRSEILEKEAKVVREKEDIERAKVERRKEREVRKKQKDEEYAAAVARAEQESRRVVHMGTRPPACTSQNITIKHESEVADLAKKFGISLSLLPEQKLCLRKGGTVTLSFNAQPVA